MQRFARIVIILLAGTATALAATPPALVNYQGVLRDASDAPLDGGHDMVFRFFDLASAGNEILVDRHLASGGAAVAVTGGLFNVWLGGGQVADGSGPGTYTSLATVFRDHSELWLQIEVDGEVLSPRVRFVAAGYALNAGHLDGFDSGSFVNTSSTHQVKAGPLTLDASGATAYGVEAHGMNGGGYFTDSDGTGYAYVGRSTTGIMAYGSLRGGYFSDTDSSGYAYVAEGDYGIRAFGNTMGGRFKDLDASGLAYAAYGDIGLQADGNTAGGHFTDADTTGEAWVGYGGTGIEASGGSAGGYFFDSNSTGYGYVGYGNYGVRAAGSLMGGYFSDTDNTGYAYLGYADRGIYARGSQYAGYFSDTDGTSAAFVGYGEYGVDAEGATAGGYFEDSNETGYAYLGYGNTGLQARGSFAGAYFADLDGTGRAHIAYNDEGIRAYGEFAGGNFYDSSDRSYCHVANEAEGIECGGDSSGAHFWDRNDSSRVDIAWGDYGIWARGDTYGGEFDDLTSGTYVYSSYGASSTYGNGAKNFVQNHPYDPGKVIVYSALEGDEVGTYTRGTARLVDGEARVALGDTFRWVTNPEVGLTAQVTSRSPGAVLYVESLTTGELVVRAVGGFAEDARFDYVVSGLRVGFEEASVLREKDREAYLPLLDADAERYEKDPRLRSYNAYERFRTMQEAVGDAGTAEAGAAGALQAAIGLYDPEVHRARTDLPPKDPPQPYGPAGSSAEEDGDFAEREGARAADPDPGSIPGNAVATAGPIEAGGVEEPRTTPAPTSLATPMPVSEAVEPGDVVALDPERPGRVRKARFAGDTALFGVVAAGETAGLAPATGPLSDATVAITGIVECNADAGYGPIRPGDLLTTSPTPGHAMLAHDPVPGSLLGKAIDPLEVGTGTIRVLVLPR